MKAYFRDQEVEIVSFEADDYVTIRFKYTRREVPVKQEDVVIR